MLLAIIFIFGIFSTLCSCIELNWMGEERPVLIHVSALMNFLISWMQEMRESMEKILFSMIKRFKAWKVFSPSSCVVRLWATKMLFYMLLHHHHHIPKKCKALAKLFTQLTVKKSQWMMINIQSEKYYFFSEILRRFFSEMNEFALCRKRWCRRNKKKRWKKRENFISLTHCHDQKNGRKNLFIK